MNISIEALILLISSPAVSAIITIIAGIISVSRKHNKDVDKITAIASDRVNQTAKDVAVIKSKLTSIENQMKKNKEK